MSKIIKKKFRDYSVTYYDRQNGHTYTKRIKANSISGAIKELKWSMGEPTRVSKVKAKLFK